MDLYSRLSTKSKRALLKVSKRYGHPYYYKPRGNLIKRLAAETGKSFDEIFLELMQLRYERLTAMGYTNKSGIWEL